MTKFKVGDKVRVLDASKIIGGDVHYFDGMETEVVALLFSEYPKLRNKNGRTGATIAEEEFEYIELIKPTKNQRITALEEKVAELEKIVEGLQQTSVQVGVDWANDKDVTKVSPLLTNNQKRAAIIEKAKRFVEEQLTKDFPDVTIQGIWFGEYLTPPTDKAEFVVNDEKRAVTVLIKGIKSNTLFAKGIAKCHPYDVFNEHIGKAIALGRALGLDVSEFEQAVQPDEVVVGMEIQYKPDFELQPNKKRIIKSINGKKITFTSDKYYLEYNNSVLLDDARVTNDTNAEYPS